MAIQLEISEVCEEIRHLKDAALDLLDASAEGVLTEFERSLQTLSWSGAGPATKWQIRRENPLVTNVSRGEFCSKGKTGAHDCLAKIMCVWDVAPVTIGKKKHKVTHFQVVDIASVHVEVLDIDTRMLLASWRVELGTDGAPGCYFHTQILAEKGRTECPFPHTFDIPRLPSYLFTPMSVVEFVLAELFQERWRSPARQASSSMRGWARIQRDRLLRTFLWHARQTMSASGSPWTQLKSAVPPRDWFIRTDFDLHKLQGILPSG